MAQLRHFLNVTRSFGLQRILAAPVKEIPDDLKELTPEVKTEENGGYSYKEVAQDDQPHRQTSTYNQTSDTR